MDEGTLWRTVVEQTKEALACGALQPIQTAHTTVEDGGIPFFIRYVSSLLRKDVDKRAANRSDTSLKNPFLPPEPPLTVANILDTHVAVLNKFNVLEHHLLLVTREYEHQQSALTNADFAALWDCLMDYPSLGFYNSGETAGASQAHKHLQLVPLPLSQGESVPINKALPEPRKAMHLHRIPSFSFDHCFCRIPEFSSAVSAGDRTVKAYRSMLDKLGLAIMTTDEGAAVAQPYNLLLSREWMLLVPRSAETFEGISINALGYAGSFFVRHKEQIEIIRRHGPLFLLRRAGMVSD